MLESFINFNDINERPWLIAVWGFVVCTIAILLSSYIDFHVLISNISVNLSGLFAVMFTIIPSVFFVTLMIKREEALEESYIKKHYHESKFFERHVKDFVIFLYFFAGVTLAFAVWYIMLPGDMFIVQSATISEIRSSAGAVTEIYQPMFSTILPNNLGVMGFSFVFSFIFGAGAVFIIVWNASVLGVAIGKSAASLLDIPIVTSLYVLHGVPEIAGYIAAALAGGLISVAMIRRHGSRVFNKVLFDALLIMVFAIFSIVCGAFIEASGGLFFWGSLCLWWGVFIYMLLRFFFKP